MGNVLDVVFLAIAVLAVLRGLKRGLFGSLSGLLGYLIAYLIASRSYKLVAMRMDEAWHISSLMQKWLQASVPAYASGQAVPIPIPQAELIGRQLLLGFAFVVAFVVVRLVLALVGGALSSMLQAIPIVGSVDRLGGAAAGLLEGALLVAFLAILLVIGQPFLQMPGLSALIDHSRVMSALTGVVKQLLPAIHSVWQNYTVS